MNVAIDLEDYQLALQQRDSAKQELVQLRTRVDILEIDLARSRKDAAHYRRMWNDVSERLQAKINESTKARKRRRRRDRS